MLNFSGGTKNFRYWRILCVKLIHVFVHPNLTPMASLIIIESGMIYSVALICEITLYFLNSNAFYIIYDPIAQLTVCATVYFIAACSDLLANRQ